jgi:hypothetical protein
MPSEAPKLTWKQAFAPYATPILPEIDLVFSIRVDSEYYHSVLHHAVAKAQGGFTSENLQAFLQQAMVEYYEAQKGKPQAAEPDALESAEACVPSPGKGRGGKVLRVNLTAAVKRDVATRLLLRRYGSNVDAAKRSFTKEALLAKLQVVLG